MYICEFVFLTWILEQCFISPGIFIFIIWKSAWRRELCTNSCHLNLLIKNMLPLRGQLQEWPRDRLISQAPRSWLHLRVSLWYLLSFLKRHFESVIPAEVEMGCWFYYTAVHKKFSFLSHSVRLVPKEWIWKPSENQAERLWGSCSPELRISYSCIIIMSPVTIHASDDLIIF